MRLYVCNNNNQKVYLNITAPTRHALANMIGGYDFFLGNNLYSVYNVRAEKNSNGTAAGAVVGGTVGALGGPLGIFIGGMIGGLIGNTTDEEENRKINRFNRS